MQQGPSNERLLALFLLGVVAFNFPLLAVLEGDGNAPVLWIGLFAIWAAFIVLIRLLFGRQRGERKDD
ncbi:hypothetical protein [Arhodomonas sp. SL1]|uniref:hypothetical protein n=1 Tax=Arhodomonas sp. SL1 TaxID=3425691 RepID=UPI003F884B29